MTSTIDPVQGLWRSVLARLTTDDRITPQLHGFISLVEPKGVLGDTLYLEVPNELTRGMLEQRIREPLLDAIATLDDTSVASFAITVNPDITPDTAQPAARERRAGPVRRGALRAGARRDRPPPASAPTRG